MIRRALAVCACALVPFAALADDDENPAIAYRESLMTLVGSNFGPMAMMIKGDIPWDAAMMAGWGKDLKAVTGLNILRGFPPGSEGGEAKPGIWKNMDDFRTKLEAMQLEAGKLGEVAMGGDKTAIGEQLAATGKTCKACHDDYREKHD